MVSDLDRREEHRQIKIFMVLTYCNQSYFWPRRTIESSEVVVLERRHDLPHPIRPEVEEHERVAIFDAAVVRAVRGDDRDRLHELVRHSLLVEAAKRLDRMLRLRADAEGHEV